MPNNRNKYTKKQLEKLSIEELRRIDKGLYTLSKPTQQQTFTSSRDRQLDTLVNRKPTDNNVYTSAEIIALIDSAVTRNSRDGNGDSV